MTFEEAAQHLTSREFSRLTPAIRRIVGLRLGRGGTPPLTVKQAARLLGVTRQRIYQAQKIAVREVEWAKCEPAQLAPYYERPVQLAAVLMRIRLQTRGDA